MLRSLTSHAAAASSVEQMKARRRARPMLGTLVEISLPDGASDALFEQGFAAIVEVQRLLSRFDDKSEITRFHGLATGESMALSPVSARVLQLASLLQTESDSLFDISQGSGPVSWRLRGNCLYKLAAGVRLDLGGIAKGFAVDRAIATLRGSGARWACVNAGGDLRVFGGHAVRISLRDELSGGVRDFGTLEQGSFTTSLFAPAGRSVLHADKPTARHVSIAAPRCVWADALTKIVAASGDVHHPLLTRFAARAWLH